jgi:hypothetical protein
VGSGVIAGSRIIAALAAATIVVGAQTTMRFERLDATETTLVASLSAPMPALHAVSVHRAPVAVRSLSRLPAHLDAALPAYGQKELRHSGPPHSVTVGASEQLRASIVSRGYDATAPPALS